MRVFWCRGMDQSSYDRKSCECEIVWFSAFGSSFVSDRDAEASLIVTNFLSQEPSNFSKSNFADY